MNWLGKLVRCSRPPLPASPARPSGTFFTRDLRRVLLSLANSSIRQWCLWCSSTNFSFRHTLRASRSAGRILRSLAGVLRETLRVFREKSPLLTSLFCQRALRRWCEIHCGCSRDFLLFYRASKEGGLGPVGRKWLMHVLEEAHPLSRIVRSYKLTDAQSIYRSKIPFRQEKAMDDFSSGSCLSRK